MIVHTENSKDATRKLGELINEFSTVAGYKIDIQTSVAFLYTNNKRYERKIKETVSFAIASKGIKHTGINLSKEAKGLYAKNYKTLMNEIEDYTNRWEHISCSWIEKNEYYENDYTIQCNLQIQCNVYQITKMAFSTELEQII